MKNSRFRGKSGPCDKENGDFLTVFWQYTPKATERTQAMLFILPEAVSEHFMLKKRLRKQEPLTRTHLCGYAKQEKSSLHHS